MSAVIKFPVAAPYDAAYNRLGTDDDLTYADIDALCTKLEASPFPHHRLAAREVRKTMGESAAAEVNRDARASLRRLHIAFVVGAALLGAVCAAVTISAIERDVRAGLAADG